MFYEDSSYAELLKLSYLHNGLIRGEHAVYATHEDPDLARRSMESRGIDVKRFESLELLHIPKVTPLLSNNSAEIRKFYSNLFSGVKAPFRVVGPSIPQVRSREEIMTNLLIERNIQSTFEERVPFDGALCASDGSMLCHYVTNSSGPTCHLEWVEENTILHHASITVPSHGRALVTNNTEQWEIQTLG